MTERSAAKRKQGRKCQSAWPIGYDNSSGGGADWFPCLKRGDHRVCEFDGIVYDNGPHQARMTLRWRTA